MEDANRLIGRFGGALRRKAPAQTVDRPVSTPRLVRGQARSHGRGLWWTFGAGLVLAGAVIVAIVQNGDAVRLHYLAWHVNVSLIVVVLTTALIAVVLDEVGGLIWRRRRRSRLGRRSELEQLRSDRRLADEALLAAESPPPAAVPGARASGRL
jgi:uncharacterized integral membrane protein